MPKIKKKPSLSWEDAPDTVGVAELMNILGVGRDTARNMFNSVGFPRIPAADGSLKADKEAARLFIQGFRVKENSKGLEYLILLELKKLNENFERSAVENV